MSKLIVYLIVFLALLLRFYPGFNHLLWNTSDFARDAYTMRQMVENRDIRLLGPRSEVYDQGKEAYLVFHGPLFYYVFALPYFLSQGDPNWALILNIFIHLTILIPMGLLAWRMFASKRAVLLILLLTAVSYELIEYSRWLLNPALALPALAWFFYFLYELYTRQRQSFLTGLFLGLAIQSEIFLFYYLLAFVFAIGYLKFIRSISAISLIRNLLVFIFGFLLGLLPMFLAELKFKFRSTISLVNYFLSGSHSNLTLFSKWGRFFDHLAVVSQHNLLGFDKNLALVFIIILLFFSFYIYQKGETRFRQILNFIYLLFFTHSLIFLTDFQNSIYIDLGFGIVLILLFEVINYYLWTLKRFYLSYLLIVLVCVSQLFLLQRNVLNKTPFSNYFFLKSDTLLFSDRLEVVDMIYQLADGNDFSISVLDLPYGWQALWGSVFEQYAIRHQMALPKWYGFSVKEVPGDSVFMTTDEISPIHFVIRPETSSIDAWTALIFDNQQDQLSSIQSRIYLNNIIIEKRFKR